MSTSDIVKAGTQSSARKKRGKYGNKGRGGDRGEIGEYRWDPECRYEKHWNTGIHQTDCKILFGDEFTWAKNERSQKDPYGHVDWTGAHYHCPSFAFHHKCERVKHSGNTYDCCINNIHEHNKNTTGESTCSPSYRGPSAKWCYDTVRTYCSPQGTIEKTRERANTKTMERVLCD